MQKSRLAYLIIVGALAVLPLFFHGNRYVMHVMILFLIWAVVAAAWDLIIGYAGVVSLGQLAFFAVGGYASGMLSIYLAVSPWVGILAGGVAAGVIGFGIGLPCLRLRGIYVAAVSLGLHLVMPTLLMRGRRFGTGGWYGLSKIPPLEIFSPLELVPTYYVGLGLFVLLLYIIYRVINSSIGLAFVALREAEPFAESLGVDQYKYRLMVYTMSAFFTGVIGGFYAHYISKITPAVLNLDVFLLVMVMIVLGGKARFPGAVIGAFVLTILNEILRAAEIYRVLVLGLIIVLTMIFMPDGLMGSFDSIRRTIKKTPKTSSPNPVDT
jgi:branched-chain amino acid transport system permease protein